MMQRAKVDSNEAIRGIIKIQSRQQCMFTYNLPGYRLPCQTLTRIKENMIMKKISLKYISICLSICLLTTALLPWLPSAAHANGPSYSMRQFYKLPEAEKSGSDRILLYNREDLVAWIAIWRRDAILPTRPLILPIIFTCLIIALNIRRIPIRPGSMIEIPANVLRIMMKRRSSFTREPVTPSVRLR